MANNKYLDYIYRISDFFEKTYYFSKSIVVSKIFKRTIAVSLVILSVLYLLPSFFDNSSLKFKLISKVNEITGADISIGGDIEFRFLPTPSVIINDLVVKSYIPKQNKDGRFYDFYAEKILVKIPFFGISANNIARSVTLYNPLIESYWNFKGFSENTDVSKILEKFSKDSPSKAHPGLMSKISSRFFNPLAFSLNNLKMTNIANINIINGKVGIYDQVFRVKYHDKVNLNIKHLKTGFNMVGGFITNGNLNTLDLLMSFDGSSYLNIASSQGLIKINGTFEGSDFFNSKFEGKIVGEIYDLKNFYGNFFNQNDFVYNKLNPSIKTIKFGANILGKEGEFFTSNFDLSSDSLRGSGNIDIGLNNEMPTIDIALSLENLDVDEIWSYEPIDASVFEVNQKSLLLEDADSNPKDKNFIGPSKEDLLNNNEKKYSVAKNIDLTIEIASKKAIYLGGEINDVSFYASITGDGKAMILPLKFLTPGGGNFRFTGVVDNSSKLPKFVGKMDAKGDDLESVFKWLNIKSQNLKYDTLKDYEAYADVLLLPNNIILDNIYLNLQNEVNEFLGRVSISKDENKNNLINISLKGTELNVEDYFLTSGKNAYLSPGSFLEKIFWLNDIYSKNDVSLEFDKLIYHGDVFFDQKVNFKLARGYLKITDFALKSQNTDLKADLTLDITGKTPFIDLKVSSNKFHFLSYKLPETELADDKPKTITFYDHFYAIPSLKGFEGAIELSLKEIKIDDLKVQEFDLSGEIVNGAIKPAKVESKIYDGSFSYDGLIEIGINKIFNGSIIFKNANLKEILSNTINVNNIVGTANIAASITSSAANSRSFIKNTYGEINFNSNSLTISSFGLSDLITKMFARSRFNKELNEPEKILFNPQLNTTYTKATGQIKILDSETGSITVKLSAPALNSILSASINPSQTSITGSFNSVFLTGNLTKQIPINIATNINVNKAGISQKTNLIQVKQYLNVTK